MDLSTWSIVTCDQQYPPGEHGAMWGSTAGVVDYQGKREVMVCGDLGRKGCNVWTDDGWVETNPDYDR